LVQSCCSVNALKRSRAGAGLNFAESCAQSIGGAVGTPRPTWLPQRPVKPVAVARNAATPPLRSAARVQRFSASTLLRN